MEREKVRERLYEFLYEKSEPFEIDAIQERMLESFIFKEIDKAREEGRREYARELLDDYYQPDSDSITVDVSEIQSELSKLKDNK